MMTPTAPPEESERPRNPTPMAKELERIIEDLQLSGDISSGEEHVYVVGNCHLIPRPLSQTRRHFFVAAQPQMKVLSRSSMM